MHELHGKFHFGTKVCSTFEKENLLGNDWTDRRRQRNSRLNKSEEKKLCKRRFLCSFKDFLSILIK